MLDQGYLKELDKQGFVYSPFHFETLNIFNYLCPVCKASDRERLYAMFLKNNLNTNLIKNYIKLLEFAPSKALKKFIVRNPQLEYKTADLYLKPIDYQVDISAMPALADNSFDIILCSHVLEHVPNDRQALKELQRILKPHGWAIIMVPIMLDINEDLEYNRSLTAEERWKYYAQDDHVRLYSRAGFLQKLVDAGFKVKMLDQTFFGADEFASNGIHPRSVLYVVEK
ncbi:MAG: methyltransferase domain-containing protein [Candidatus Margulisbacteria bacterium]|nr:methyltransferase domain-containing protein [Candidatus Margulisiibacteriota bacterium]